MPDDVSTLAVPPRTIGAAAPAAGRRVCMFVYNNCASDPRVLKEAASLTGAGYEVQIVAVLDKTTVPEEDRDGTRIVRIDRNPLHYKLLRRTRRTRARIRQRRGKMRLGRRRLLARMRRRRNKLRLGRRRAATAIRRHPVLGVIARGLALLVWPLKYLVVGIFAALGLIAAGVVAIARALRWRLFRLLPPVRRLYNRFGPNLRLRAHRRRYLRAAAARRSGLGSSRRRKRSRAKNATKLGPRIDRAVSNRAYRSVMFFHKPLMYLDWYWRAYRRLARDRFDIYHAHDLNTLPVASLLARRAKARLIFDAHELYPEVSTLSARESRIWKRVERRFIGRADQVITVCESIANELVKRHGVGNPTVLLNCPAAAPLPEPREVNLLRERAGLLDDPDPVVLYQGGFSTHRGLPELIRAAHSFERGTLVLMGWGNIEEELREQIRRERLEGKVRIIGPATREELPFFTVGADIGVIPYRPVGMNNTFTTPNKLFEYIAAGLPIAGSRLPELVRFVEGYGLGVTFDPERPTDIAAAINQVLLDDDLRAEMRRRAVEVRDLFVWEEQSKVLLATYERGREAATR